MSTCCGRCAKARAGGICASAATWTSSTPRPPSSSPPACSTSATAHRTSRSAAPTARSSAGRRISRWRSVVRSPRRSPPRGIWPTSRGAGTARSWSAAIPKAAIWRCMRPQTRLPRCRSALSPCSAMTGRASTPTFSILPVMRGSRRSSTSRCRNRRSSACCSRCASMWRTAIRSSPATASASCSISR